MPAQNAPTQTNPPFTSPPTWPFPSTALWWEADYRLRLLESAIIYAWANGLPPSGPGTGAGGDLGGTYPNPTVLKINGQPVSATIPSLNQTLVWNGTAWVPTTLASSFPPSGTAAGDLSGSYPNPTVKQIQGQAVSATAPTVNQVLEWNGSTWIASNLPAALPPNGPASGDLSSSYPSPQVAHEHVPFGRAFMTGTVTITGAWGAYGFAGPTAFKNGVTLGLGNWMIAPITAIYQINIFIRLGSPVATSDFLDVLLGNQNGGTFTRLGAPEGVAGAGAWGCSLNSALTLTAGQGYGPYITTGGGSYNLQTSTCEMSICYITE